VDLARLLGIPRAEPAGQLLVVGAGGEQAGFVIDEVARVGELPDPTEDTESRLLRGALLTDGELVGVIDVPAVFGALAGERP
jgi:chemotaxis signal transduction protein